MMKFSRPACALSALLLLACGATAFEDPVQSADGGAADGAGASGDAGNIESSRRAVVVSVNRTGNSNDSVEVWSVGDDGVLDRGSLSFGPIDNPRRVALRSDGREALCAWGTLGGEFGVTVLSLQADGSAAEVVQTIVMGSGKNVFGLAYASDDHAIIAVASSGEHSLISLDRGADGQLATGLVSAVENDWPLEVLKGPDGKALVHRAYLLDEPSSEIIPLSQTQSGWTRAGSSGFIAPASIHAVVSGQNIYSSTSDPADPLSEDNPQSDGILHRYSYAGGDVVAQADFPLPDTGSMIAADPKGKYLVVAENVFEFGASGTPNSRGFRWMTIELDEEGVPTSATTDERVFPSLLFNALAITAEDTMLAAYILYDDQAPAPGQTNPVQGFARVAGAWQPVGEPIFAGGLTQMAIAAP